MESFSPHFSEPHFSEPAPHFTPHEEPSVSPSHHEEEETTPAYRPLSPIHMNSTVGTNSTQNGSADVSLLPGVIVISVFLFVLVLIIVVSANKEN